MANVTFGKIIYGKCYYGKFNYGKCSYDKRIMAHETEPSITRRSLNDVHSFLTVLFFFRKTAPFVKFGNITFHYYHTAMENITIHNNGRTIQVLGTYGNIPELKTKH